MSVTVIQSPDETSSAFLAWRTIEEIKSRAKQAAIDQALAQQHLQSAKTIDSLNQAKLQMENQQAMEFTSPEAVTRRRDAMDTALGQEKANLESTTQSNAYKATVNPLHVLQEQQLTQQAAIATKSAQKHLDALDDLLSGQKNLNDLTIKAKQYELEKSGIDLHTATLRSKVEGAQLTGQLEQVPSLLKLQQSTIDSALTEIGQKPVLERLRAFSTAASQLGVPGAKAAVAGIPGYENFQHVPDESVGSKNEKDREFHMLMSLARDGDVDAQTVLGARLAKGAGVVENPLSSMTDPKTGKPIIAPNEVSEAAKRVAKNFATKAKLDPATGDYYIGDAPPKFGQVPNMESTFKGSIPLGNVGGTSSGSVAPATTPPPPASPPVQSGTQKIEGGLSPQSLTDSQQVLNDLDTSLQNSTVTKMSYHANRENKDVKDIVFRPYDKSYSLTREGEIYNWSEYNKGIKSGNTVRTVSGPEEGKPLHGVFGRPNSVWPLAKSDIQTVVSNAMTHVDKDASAAQEARYRVAVSQLVRAYQEGGKSGLNQMYNLLADRYRAFKSGDEKGISSTQWENLISIVTKYGAQ